jgi:hypothetical protein
MIVYGSRFGGGTRAIALVKSKAEFARLTGLSIGDVSKYGQVTGNDVEVATAYAHPGVVLVTSESSRDPKSFRTLDGKTVEAVFPMKDHSFVPDADVVTVCERCLTPQDRHPADGLDDVRAELLATRAALTSAQTRVKAYTEAIAALRTVGENALVDLIQPRLDVTKEQRDQHAADAQQLANELPSGEEAASDD